MEIIRGLVHKFGDHIDTDQIIPARYLNTSDANELAKHCLESVDPGFSKKVRPGDIIVAGENFGCGSSREHAPLAIKAAGISAVVAASFARIFYRNAFNIGLPIFESPQAAADIKAGEEIEINPSKGKIKNLTSGKIYPTQPYPEFIQKLVSSGGLINFTKEKIKS